MRLRQRGKFAAGPDARHGCVGFGLGRTLERVGPARGVDGPLPTDAGDDIVRDVRVEDAERAVGLDEPELVHVIGPCVGR